jgi:two-component system, cell cycle sensor histidine kinase and response regulator CckA
MRRVHLVNRRKRGNAPSQVRWEDETIVKRLAQFASPSQKCGTYAPALETTMKNERQHARNFDAAKAGSKAHLEDRRREEPLQQINGELKTRIAASTAPLAKSKLDVAPVVAGVAHDFSNILNVIGAYATLIISHPAESNNVIGEAEIIRKAVEEGVALTRRLLAAGQKTETKIVLVDINDLLQRTTKSLAPMFPTTTVIAADLDPHVPMIMIDAGLIYQAILNLCINARDAMPDGGKILVQTRTTSGVVLRQHFPEAGAEQYVYISVADTGVGMDEAVKSRAFESYFTTKEPGEGTGLGLSIVHGIVSEHAGFIEVTSKPGWGSTIHIYLPLPKHEATADDIAPPLAQHKIEDRSQQGETILYAEDNVLLAGLTQRLLEREGFRVLTAQNGFEAVDLHRCHRGEIVLAVLDSHLPKLDGLEAFRRMRKINPKLKGILASGFVSAEAESHVAQGELCGVLQKPYFGAELLAMIKHVIKSR